MRLLEASRRCCLAGWLKERMPERPRGGVIATISEPGQARIPPFDDAPLDLA